VCSIPFQCALKVVFLVDGGLLYSSSSNKSMISLFEVAAVGGAFEVVFLVHGGLLSSSSSNKSMISLFEVDDILIGGGGLTFESSSLLSSSWLVEAVLADVDDVLIARGLTFKSSSSLLSS